jgi:hypothetical protein
MIRDAFEILSWYLSPRRLPWFAIAEFAIMLGAIVAYESTQASVWIIVAAASSGFGTYLAAHFYMDFDQRPETKRERQRLERQNAEWYGALSERDKAKIRALSENMAQLSRQSGISFKDAAAAMRRFN